MQIMSPLFVFFNIFFLYLHLSNSQLKVSQQHAKVIRYDPHYVKDPQAFTFRNKRGEPYRTNITGTTLHPLHNNVSIRIDGKNQYMNHDMITYKLCEGFSNKWVVDYLRECTNIEPKCPLSAGSYGFYNMELPPKNFPLPIPKGTGKMGLTVYKTAKPKDILFQVEISLTIA